MNTCNVCEVEKSIEDFPKGKGYKNGNQDHRPVLMTEEDITELYELII